MILPAQFANTVREGDSILFCPYCSRILFYEESEDEDEEMYFRMDDAGSLADLSDEFDEDEYDSDDEEKEDSFYDDENESYDDEDSDSEDEDDDSDEDDDEEELSDEDELN